MCYLRNSRVLLLAGLCNNRPHSHLSGKGNRVVKAMVSCEAAGRLQQQVGTTLSTGTASPPALQAVMLNSVSHHRLSQLWAGWGTEEWLTGSWRCQQGCQPHITSHPSGHCALTQSQRSPAASWPSGMFLLHSPPPPPPPPPCISRA